MSKLTAIVIFTAGSVIGAIGAWKYIKDKYERLAQEEIDSVKAVFLKKSERNTEETNEKSGVSDYDNLVYDNGYTRYSDKVSIGNESDKSNIDTPYVISPDEFGNLDDYGMSYLTYYANGVFVEDCTGDIIEDEDIAEIVGSMSLKSIGEYEDSSVHVRNDRLKCDYEILYDMRNYPDTIESGPSQVEE